MLHVDSRLHIQLNRVHESTAQILTQLPKFRHRTCSDISRFTEGREVLDFIIECMTNV